VLLLLVTEVVRAAGPTPSELLDGAIKNAGSRVIRSGSTIVDMQSPGDNQRLITNRCRMVFDGDDAAGTIRQEYLRPDGSKNSPPLVMISGPRTADGVTSLRTNAVQGVHIRNSKGSPITSFRHFGRLDNRYGQFADSGTTLGAWFADPVRLVAKESFEGSEVYVVEIGRSNGKRKVWIDPARGYICPRNEFYDGDRLVRKTESSGYFLEPTSKLYFPAFHKESVWDAQQGYREITLSYRVEPKSLRLNCPVPSEEFSISVAPSTRIVDSRGGGRDWQSTKEVSLEFAAGKLDLERIDGLVATSAPRPIVAASRFLPDTFSTAVKWIVAAIAVVVTLLLVAAVWILKLVVTRTRLVE